VAIAITGDNANARTIATNGATINSSQTGWVHTCSFESAVIPNTIFGRFPVRFRRVMFSSRSPSRR
jgi:hypothetical protein